MEIVRIVIYASIYLGLVATSFFILSYISDRKKKKLLFSDSELPKVSIIIAAYNEEKSIAGTIKTILASDYPKEKFELIVIDDGSKDKTLEISKRFEEQGVRVFSKKNAGKGSALNFGIKKAKGEIIFSSDADTIVNPESVKNMVRYFKDKNVASVTPAMVIAKPRGLWQRIQHIEYLSGLFLRKAFAAVNAIHITPGCFSAYRKSFFDKYGDYEEGNITEDLELSLRIQYNGYIIENSLDAPVYTIPPKDFKSLLIQRRRWYYGLLKNSWKYKKIFSPKYGDLGVFVFPVAWLGIFFSLFVLVYFIFKNLFRLKEELLFLSSINFDFGNLFNLNFYLLERFFLLLVSNPIVIFLSFFIIVLGFYLVFATRRVSNVSNVFINLPLFFIFFATLFGVWWLVTIFYSIFNKEIKWR